MAVSGKSASLDYELTRLYDDWSKVFGGLALVWELDARA
jgi:hypothetical protein